jgi:excisionase family DNA binding protein
MPNTWIIFCSTQSLDFLGLSPRRINCSTSSYRTPRQRVCEPRFAASDLLEQATMDGIQSPLALRPREAAKALGISPRLLWQLTKDGQIPCVRVGSGKRRTVLYPLADLQAWLTRQAATSKGGEQ